jgi:hypothetical protein
MKQIETKLFIEEDKSNNECNIVIRVSSLPTKEDAVHLATFIMATRCIDFSDIMV